MQSLVCAVHHIIDKILFVCLKRCRQLQAVILVQLSNYSIETRNGETDGEGNADKDFRLDSNIGLLRQRPLIHNRQIHGALPWAECSHNCSVNHLSLLPLNLQLWKPFSGFILQSSSGYRAAACLPPSPPHTKSYTQSISPSGGPQVDKVGPHII